VPERSAEDRARVALRGRRCSSPGAERRGRVWLGWWVSRAAIDAVRVSGR